MADFRILRAALLFAICMGIGSASLAAEKDKELLPRVPSTQEVTAPLNPVEGCPNSLVTSPSDPGISCHFQIQIFKWSKLPTTTLPLAIAIKRSSMQSIAQRPQFK